ncbi:unnamed protein product [Owenia fusiformis]|uniref:Uncharacterized protein n=1 Tax=Owenia fusiformis TaxID=6347 RepID=A0A8J1UWT2_OWEFU|nr:unnamed protein product [Owenia fusiformis]
MKFRKELFAILLTTVLVLTWNKLENRQRTTIKTTVKNEKSLDQKNAKTGMTKLIEVDTVCDVMLNIITTFPVLNSNDDLNERGFFRRSLVQFEKRQMDFVQSLLLNMQHPCVERIHLLVDNMAVEDYIKTHNLTKPYTSEIKKMVHFHKLSHYPTYNDYAKYTNENLMKKTIAVMNADVSLGNGFDLIKMRYLTEGKVAYCLTRHPTLLANCKSYTAKAICAEPYNGSHDVHVFYMDTAFDDWSLNFLTFPINRAGVENLFMYVIKKRLKKNILNPCSILKTHHNHCSGIRSRYTSTRLDRGVNLTYSTHVGYSTKLV